MNKDNNTNKSFPGFPPKPSTNFWSYPKVMNGFWHTLTGSEQKVLDYILRHTWGFNKVNDEISLTQLKKGIKNFDKGTGLTRPTIILSLKILIKGGFIKKTKGKKANCYELVKDFNYPSKKYLLSDSKKSLPTIEENTIKEEQYNFSSKKELAESYKQGKRNSKPYFRGEEMRWSQGRWWVLPNDGGDWLEFAGSELEIEWK